jgi:hypothetical protein
MKILDYEDDDDNYNDVGSSTSVVLSASITTRCGVPSGIEVGDVHQI